jgi:hypothetical protein
VNKFWSGILIVVFLFGGCSNSRVQFAGMLALSEAKCAFEDNLRVGSQLFQKCIVDRNR